MGINSEELLQYVIRPTLHQLGEESETAEKLMLSTACYHSEMGHHIHNQDELGIFAISESLHQEVWDQFIAFDCELASQVRGMASQHEFPKEPHVELITNLRYATAIAWMVYQYRHIQLPENGRNENIADCWQQYFMHRPVSFSERNDFIQCIRKCYPNDSAIAA